MCVYIYLKLNLNLFDFQWWLALDVSKSGCQFHCPFGVWDQRVFGLAQLVSLSIKLIMDLVIELWWHERNFTDHNFFPVRY